MKKRRSLPAVVFGWVAILSGALGFAVPTQAQTAPQLVSIGGAEQVESGVELQITARFNGSGPMTFRWRRDGVEVATTLGEADGSGFVTRFVVPIAQPFDEGTYVVEATNAAGTTASAIYPVVVRTPRPPVFLEQSGDLRGPQVNIIPVTFTGSQPLVRRWFRDGVELTNQSAFLDFGLLLNSSSGGITGTYYLEVSNRAGKITSRTFRVTAADETEPFYITSQPGSRGYRFGSFGSIRANYSSFSEIRGYQWRRNGAPIAGATNLSYEFSSFEPTQAGQYSVEVTRTNGQTLVSNEAEISLVGPPSAALVTRAPRSQSVKAGTCVTLTVEAESPTGPLRYQWFKNGSALAGATRETLFLANVGVADEGRYRAEVRAFTVNEVVSSTEASLAVVAGESVPLAPVIVVAPEPRNLTAGEANSLAVRVAGYPTPTIQWLKNGTPIAGATDAVLTFTNPQSADAGSYSAVVTNASRAVRTSAVEVSVVVPPAKPVFVVSPLARVSVALGGTITLGFTTQGNPAPTFQWLKNGVPFFRSEGAVEISNSANRTSLRIGPGGAVGASPGGAETSDAGTYSVVATNQFGSVTSDPVVLEVRPPDVAGLYMTNVDPTAPESGTALYIRPDRTGTLTISSAVRPGAAATANLVVKDDGTFTTVVPNPLATDSPSTYGGSIRGDTVRIGATLSNFSAFAERTSAQGAFAAVAGYWRAPLTGGSTGFLHAIVSSQGDVVVVLQRTNGRVEALRGRLDATYALKRITPGFTFASISLQFSPGGIFSGAAVSLRELPANFSGTRVGAPLLNRLVDIATRSQAGAESDSMIAGFVVTGGVPQSVLIRAVGPTLASFGLAGALADSRLTLFRDSTKIAENDDWGLSADATAIAQAAIRVGAFALPGGSKDAVLLATLAPGAYSAQASAGAAAANARGVALIEVYDAGETPASAASPRLANISTRGRVGTADDVLVAGIVVGGDAPKRVLIRAIGPGLSAFGLPDTLADTVLRLFRGTTLMEENDDWTSSSELISATKSVGAFALSTGSKDSALLVTLAPGSYTAQVSGARGATGIALVEVYEVIEAP